MELIYFWMPDFQPQLSEGMLLYSFVVFWISLHLLPFAIALRRSS